MILEHFERGDVVLFAITPKDADDVLIEPVSVTLHINFLNEAGEREDIDPAIEMDENTAGSWTAQWDTGGISAVAGRVYWHIRTSSPDSASEGSFMLDANLANPD